MHQSVRIYPNGDTITNTVLSKDLYYHIGYNLVMRPGCALIVDKIVYSKGIGVSDELIEREMTRESFRPHSLPYL
jgi:hypothetical protein